MLQIAESEKGPTGGFEWAATNESTEASCGPSAGRTGFAATATKRATRWTAKRWL